MSYSSDFFYAAMRGDVARVRELLDQAPTLVDRYSDQGSTALHLAAHLGHLEVVKLLVERGANIEARSRTGSLRTALHIAVLLNQLDVAAYLLEHGADVNKHNGMGWTPLHLAVGRGNASMVRLLLAHGAHASITDGTGRTVEDLAQRRGRAEVIHEFAAARAAMFEDAPARALPHDEAAMA